MSQKILFLLDIQSIFVKMSRKIKYFLQAFAFFMPAFLKKIIWRCLGFKIGKRVKIGIFSLIMVDYLELADDVCIDPLTMIVLLKEFKMGEKSRVAIFSKIYGRGAFIAESRCLVSVQCLIECSPNCSVIMKDYSCFGPRNTIYTHGEYLPLLQGFPSKKGDVIIGEYSWTGLATAILPDTIIGKRTIITPGAVLIGRIPENKFVISSAYRFETIPIENKIKKRDGKEVQLYIRNVISLITTKHNIRFDSVLQEPELLFQDLPIELPENYKGKKFVMYMSDSAIEVDKNGIFLGYGLPEKIKQNKTLSWLDFQDYTAHPESDKVISQIVCRLYSKLNLRFLFWEKGKQ